MNEPTLTLEELRQQLDILASKQEPDTRTDVVEVKFETHRRAERRVLIFTQREEFLEREIRKLEDSFTTPPTYLVNFLDTVRDDDR